VKGVTDLCWKHLLNIRPVSGHARCAECAELDERKKKAINEEPEDGTALNSKGGTNMHVNVPSFLMKTYEIISDPLTNDIVAWNDEGEGFVVKHVNKF
jgi:hypothetical protein